MRSFCRSRNIEMQVAIADLKTAIDDTYKTEHFGWFNYSMYNRFTDVSLFFIAHQLKTVQSSNWKTHFYDDCALAKLL